MWSKQNFWRLVRERIFYTEKNLVIYFCVKYAILLSIIITLEKKKSCYTNLKGLITYTHTFVRVKDIFIF